MGKVIINETPATETARSGKSPDKNTNDRGERAHVDISRAKKSEKSGKSESVGIKVHTDDEKAVAVAKNANNSDKLKAKAASNGSAAPKSKSASKNNSESKSLAVVKRSEKISRFQSNNNVKIISRDLPKKVYSSKPKPEMGLVLRNQSRVVDPEIALMDSRSRAMERTRVDNARAGGRSMSGMLSERGRMAAQVGSRNPNLRANARTNASNDFAEEELQFTKAKSALIGVGVALVVAVVGFAGIALFSGNKETCVVQFESNGGSPVEGVEFVCGRAISQPEDPVKEGFTFQGWIYEGDPFDFGSGIYKNATLVAKWQAEDGVEVVKVKFDTDGGSTVSDIEVAKGKKITEPNAPTKMGYVFDDWYLGDKVFDFSRPIEENITLKAKWERRANMSTGNNTAKPDNRATSVMASTQNLDLEIGKSGTVNISVLPSASDYTLTATSSDNGVVECSVSKNVVTCTAKKAGIATVKVRDEVSRNSSSFQVVVKDNTPPEITDPDPQPEPKNYTLTVNYVDAEGNVVAQSHISTVTEGNDYSVTSPAVEGYTTTTVTVSGTMGQENRTITVTYTKNETPEPKPDPEPIPDPDPDPVPPTTE